MSAPELTAPTIHLNGSSGEELAARLEAAGAALFSAREALALTAPNARDYYPQGPDAHGRARREHDARARRLLEVQEELVQLHEHVVAAVDARAARRTR